MINFSFIFDKEKRFDFLIGLSIILSSYTFFNEPFEGYFHYLIFMGYFPLFIKKYGWLPLPVRFMILPVIVGVINLFIGDCQLFDFFKIFIGMFLSISFYNYVLHHYRFDFERLFSIYINGILICCYIGLIELISYRVGFGPGYRYYWLLNKWGLHPGGLFGLRVNSIFSEPSQFALILLPAVFVATHHLLLRDFRIISFRQAVVIYASLILTTSSTGYFGIFISLLLIGINLGKILNFVFIVFFSIIGFIGLYKWVDDFRFRVDTSINLWINDSYTLEDINSSSFVLYNNFNIAKKNMAEHPFIGTGLGSYSLAYDKYSLTKEQDFAIKKGFEFNSKDGNSLFIRTIVEMGFVGVAFWLFFILRFFYRYDREKPENELWIISAAMLTIICGYLLRQGNYFLNGFPFFALMYYYMSSRKSVEVAEGEIVNEEDTHLNETQSQTIEA
jgi:O-antigen ligase